MAITPELPGSPAIPNSKTAESVVNPAIPVSKTAEAAASPVIPISKTAETAAAAAIPNSLTSETAVSPAIPVSKTAESAIAPSIPVSKTAESVASPAIPTSKTAVTGAAVPRALTPLVDMHFDSEQYSQNGSPVTFADLFTFTRSSTGTYLGRDIVNNKAVYTVKTALANVLRIEYDAATGENLGALIEGASTNLQIRSEEFDDAAWVKTNSSITANDTEAPDGTVSGDKLVENSATATHQILDAVTLTASTPTTLSVYAKQAERTQVRIETVSLAISATFNLDDGTLALTSGSPDSTSIQSVGNGWFRVSVTFDSGAGGVNNIRILPALADGASYLGDGASGLYIWGAQVEEQPFATSYIGPTLGSSVARVADDLSIENAGNIPNSGNFSSHLKSRVELLTGGSGLSRYMYRITADSGFGLNRIKTDSDLDAAHGSDFSITAVEGVFSRDFTSTVIFNAGANNISGYVDGSLGASVDAGSLFQPDQSSTCSIGSDTLGAGHLFGHIKELSIYEEALSAQEVALL